MEITQVILYNSDWEVTFTSRAVSASQYLLEYIEDYEATEGDVKVEYLGDRATREHAKEAATWFDKLPDIVDRLKRFAYPDADRDTIESLASIHRDLVITAEKYRRVLMENSVVGWLFPVNEMTRAISKMTVSDTPYAYYRSHPFPENVQDAFEEACRNGHESVARWLYSLGGVDIHARDDYAFRWACVNGHEAIARWLYSLGGVDIHADNNYTFRWACSRGHESVARWLYSLGDINIYAGNNYAFRWACGRGRESVARWLYSLGDIDIHTDNDEAFRWACGRGHESVARWLYSLGGVDIHARDDWAFRWACCRGYEAIARWLYSLGGVDIHTDNNYAFQMACGNGHESIARWLETLP